VVFVLPKTDHIGVEPLRFRRLAQLINAATSLATPPFSPYRKCQHSIFFGYFPPLVLAAARKPHWDSLSPTDFIHVLVTGFCRAAAAGGFRRKDRDILILTCQDISSPNHGNGRKGSECVGTARVG